MFDHVITDVFIKEVSFDSESKWMVISTFNTQDTVMRCCVKYNIRKKKIKSTNEYKDIYKSTVARLNIKHLKEWIDLIFTEKVSKIFNKIRHLDITAEWKYLFYKYMILNKFLRITFTDVRKHFNSDISAYNSYWVYYNIQIKTVNIKQLVNMININIVLQMQIILNLTKTIKKLNEDLNTTVSVKNEAVKIQKLKNRYLFSLQKLGDMIAVHIMTTMKSAETVVTELNSNKN